MGAAGIRSESAYRNIYEPLMRAQYPHIDWANDELWKEVETLYLPNGDVDSARADDWRVAYIETGMDAAYVTHMNMFSEGATAVGAKHYAYTFTYNLQDPNLQDEPRIDASWNEPWHGDDLLLVFGYPFYSNQGTYEDRDLSMQLMKIWTNFVETGDAAHPDVNDGVWPEFNSKDKKEDTTIQIDGFDNYKVHKEFRTKYFALWESIFEKY